MEGDRIQDFLKFYREHTDQEFVKKILEALREGDLSEDELVEIGNWIAENAKSREGREKDY